MFANVGPSELLLVGLVLFLLFGGSKLPELTRSLLEGLRQFRSSFKEGEKAADEKDKK